MKIKTVRLVYFSPTKTTKTILESIAVEISTDVRHIDLTLPNNDRAYPELNNNELLVIGAPVYAGRIPEIAAHRFQGLKSGGNPAVLVVLYGNREFEDALLELNDFATAAGFVPIAGSAFIGEHSFSSEGTPLAKGRPDASDIDRAHEFGKSVRKLLEETQDIGYVGTLKLPGNKPFRAHAELPQASPATDNNRCAACGACAGACPTGSVSVNEVSSTHVETCILCCACVKICPQRARELKDPNIAKIIEWLHGITAGRKEPQIFLCSNCS